MAADILADHTGLLGPLDHEVEGGVDPLADPGAQLRILLEGLLQLAEQRLLRLGVAQERLEEGLDRFPGLEFFGGLFGRGTSSSTSS